MLLSIKRLSDSSETLESKFKSAKLQKGAFIIQYEIQLIIRWSLDLHIMSGNNSRIRNFPIIIIYMALPHQHML